MAAAILTRAASFSAAHRMHSNALSAQENDDIFGKCNNVHGHNYKCTACLTLVEISVKGTVIERTGMVINIAVVKEAIENVVVQLDHKNLDVDVEYFRASGKISTAENICIYIFNQINLFLPKSDTYELYQIRLWETDKNSVTYPCR